MENTDKTKEQLLKELDQLRAKIDKHEKSDSGSIKVDEALQKSNSLLNSIIESPENINMFALDKNYNYLSFNKAHVKEMKYIYDADIKVGKHIFSYMPNKEDTLKAEINYKRVLKGERFTEIQEYGEADSRFWYELIFNPIYDDSNKVTGFTVFVTNITERKQNEEELLKGKILLESSIESPKDMIILSLDKEYRYLFFNKTHAQSMVHVYGIQPKIGDCIFDYMTNKDDIEKVKAHYDRAMSGDGHISIEEYGEGNVRYYYEIRYNPVYNQQKEIIGITSFAQNITDRKLDEKNTMRLSRIFEDSLNEIFLFDTESLKFSQVNNAAQKNLGYTMEELHKMTPLDFKPEFTAESFAELVEPLRKGEQEKIVFETVHKRKNKSLYNVEVHLQLLKFDQESLFAAIIMDITERKKAEEKLIQSLEREQIQADIVRTTPIAIAYGYPDGRLDNCNKAFSILTGYSEEELKIINWNEVLTPSKWNAIESEELEKLSPENNSIRYEKEYIHKDGKIIPIELFVTAKFDDKNNLINFIGFITDITERKLIEEKLLVSDERYRLANAASDNGIWDWWIESNNVFYSDQWKAQLGYKPDEIANEFKSWEDLLHPDDKDQMFKKVMDFLASPSEYFMAEFRMRHKDGSYRWIYNKAAVVLDDDGKVIRMFGAHTNITDRKNAEEKIIEEKNKAQQYLNIADVMLISLDSLGIVQLINPKGCEILGYSEEEIIGQNWFDNFLPERLKENVKEVSKKVFSGELDLHKYYENEILTKSGNERLMAWHTSVIEDDNGKIISSLSSAEDITDRKSAEAELAKHRENLEEMVNERTKELEDKNKELDNALKVFVGREMTIKKLQERIRALGGK